MSKPYDLEIAARKLADLVEFDMNGTTGKGGNGGLLSDTTLRAAHEVHALLNCRLPAHADDIAVDGLAEAMKAKLALKRAEGLDIWRDKEACPQTELSLGLANHVRKGDPVDVANFAMMLHQRGEDIVLPPNDAASHQLNAVVDAWEALPGGRQVRNKDIEEWLADAMTPAINAVRYFLKRPRPDGTIPAAPAKQEGGE